MSQLPSPEPVPVGFLQQQKPWHLDVLMIVVLILANPLMWGYRLESGLTPDVIGYLTFAEHSIATGQMFLPGWGHVDIALLPSPLFPLLIAVTSLVGGNIIDSAVTVNVVCVLLATIPMYLMIRSMAGPWIASGGVILNHANLQYLFYGSAIYSEASFIMVMLTTLALMLHVTINKRAGTIQLLMLGALAGLAFLSRHIGIVLFVFVAGWTVADLLLRQEGWKRVVRSVLLLAAGWLALAGPYMATLYVQAHELPFKQSFRLGRYHIAVAEPSILAQIAQNDQKATDSYVDLYRKRRLQRRLLPDASEMHAYVIRDMNTLHSSPAVETLAAKLTKPGEALKNLLSNLRHLASLSGSHVLILFIIAVISALTVRSGEIARWPRMLLPAFMGVYILILSLMTGLIDRYLAILLPLVVIHIGSELGVLANAWKARFPKTFLFPAIVMIGVVASLLTAPRTLMNSSMLPPSSGLQGLTPSTVIPARDPVFVLLPFYSYMAGGSYRILPNDSLDKVVQYGQKTGVHWLIIPANPKGKLSGEISLYEYAPWLMNPSRLKKCRRLLNFHGTLTLFGEEQFIFQLLTPTTPRPGTPAAAC